MIDPLVYFWLLLKASLFSTGGFGNLPSLLSDFVSRGWATERQFAEALAVGQVSPGPNGLWVISMGYLTYGVPGALLSTIAIIIPPLLVLALDKLHRRIGDHPAVKGFVRGLGLAVVGIFLVILSRIWAESGISVISLLIVIASLGLGITKKVPVVVILIIGGIIGSLLL